MNVSKALITAVLAAGLLTTTACSSLPGTASVSISSAAAASSPASTSADSTVATTSSDAAEASTSPASPESTEDSTSDSTSDSTEESTQSSVETSENQNGTGTADAVTTTWVTSICTDMGTVLDELQKNKPQLADDTSLGTLRQAMVDYYAESTKTASAAYDDSEKLEPPHVTNGDAIHRDYQKFLSGLGDIFYDATLDMSGAADVNAVKSINNDVDQKITTLGSDNAALEAMDSGELGKIAGTIAVCQALTASAG